MTTKFAKIYNPETNTYLFMQDYDYKRYSSYPVFKENFRGYTFFKNIYINVFPLMFTLNDILEFNEDAQEIKEVKE